MQAPKRPPHPPHTHPHTHRRRPGFRVPRRRAVRRWALPGLLLLMQRRPGHPDALRRRVRWRCRAGVLLCGTTPTCSPPYCSRGWDSFLHAAPAQCSLLTHRPIPKPTAGPSLTRASPAAPSRVTSRTAPLTPPRYAGPAWQLCALQSAGCMHACKAFDVPPARLLAGSEAI